MKIVKLLLTLAIILSATSLYAGNEDKFNALLSLSERNITYDEETPLDSVICWGESLNHIFETRAEYNTFFELELLLANAYCTRGDVTLAIDKVQQMLDKANKLNYHYVGIALACQGVGDAYAAASMRKEAIESYKEAIDIWDRLPSAVTYKKRTLLKTIDLCLEENEDATPYKEEANQLIQEGDPLFSYLTLLNAYYYTVYNQLDEAKKYLDHAREQIQKEKKSILSASLSYTIGFYYSKRKDYKEAMLAFNGINEQNQKLLSTTLSSLLAAKKVDLLIEMGKNNEATKLYEQIINTKDSINAKSYSRQVNSLRTSYKVNQIELDTQTQRNKQHSLAIAFGSGLLLLAIALTLYIIYSNKLLVRSRKQMENAKNQADQSVKAKSMIMSNMSHEIRTPLNALTGFSAILTEDSIDNETRNQCNEIIQQNSELLLKLINDVIDLSSLEFGKMQFNFKDNDAVSICRNVVDTVRKIKQTSVDIRFATQLEELILHTDEARLQQVLINLLVNATKFTQSGSITLELTINDRGKALFTVTDTGCGIPLEKQSKIFGRFEKLNEMAQGTGLGLSICQLIVNHVGGDIWIDPTYTDGSRFCFTHPLKK
ncbi:sensor histidine kinase [Bacteroides sp. 214]|uniref:tetratricopeptide repeat-containing sensor histidine kinase n=1 Tax=Bacteroides sp. 214 TaxID=2302935 RepID=UPI0013D7A9DB|nr:sensor histidine kinase [Bacteroides sp. 214]